MRFCIFSLFFMCSSSLLALDQINETLRDANFWQSPLNGGLPEANFMRTDTTQTAEYDVGQAIVRMISVGPFPSPNEHLLQRIVATYNVNTGLRTSIVVQWDKGNGGTSWFTWNSTVYITAPVDPPLSLRQAMLAGETLGLTIPALNPNVQLESLDTLSSEYQRLVNNHETYIETGELAWNLPIREAQWADDALGLAFEDLNPIGRYTTNSRPIYDSNGDFVGQEVIIRESISQDGFSYYEHTMEYRRDSSGWYLHAQEFFEVDGSNLEIDPVRNNLDGESPYGQHARARQNVIDDAFSELEDRYIDNPDQVDNILSGGAASNEDKRQQIREEIAENLPLTPPPETSVQQNEIDAQNETNRMLEGIGRQLAEVNEGNAVRDNILIDGFNDISESNRRLRDLLRGIEENSSSGGSSTIGSPGDGGIDDSDNGNDPVDLGGYSFDLDALDSQAASMASNFNAPIYEGTPQPIGFNFSIPFGDENWDFWLGPPPLGSSERDSYDTLATFVRAFISFILPIGLWFSIQKTLARY